MNEAIKEYIQFEKLKDHLIQNTIDLNMINRLFKYYGISNTIDKIENSLIFNFNKVEDISNQKRKIEEENKMLMKMNQIIIIEINWKMMIMIMKMIIMKVMKIII